MFNPVILEESTVHDFAVLQRDLDRAKSALFMSKDAAFFGPLMCTLNFVWAKGLKTAATDGSTFWWDPDDFIRCDIEERKSTIMHELWHVARLHALRRGSRCPDVWNKACDIKINRDLISQGYKKIEPPYWLHRPDITEELEEEIYELLNKQGGAGAPPPGQPAGGAGNQPTPAGQTPGQGQPHNCSHGQVPVTPQVKQQMLNATVKAIQSAKMSQQAGSIPGDLELIVNKFLKPVIPWETVLYQFFNDMSDEDYSWSRPNRRYEDMYLPHRQGDDRLEHLIYYLDVSGSVSDHDVLRFNSEVKFIKEVFNPIKLTLVQFDTIIQQERVFHEEDPFDEIVVVGRGGTSLIPVREHIEKHKPSAAIIFSDLYCTPMEPGVKTPVIWIAVGNTSAQVPFGKLVHIKE
jgi:predicted metal-dependent peptidase